ncbi:hypothetical protein NQ318_023063 [Aromia moschata]|uniref:Glyoxylate reductase/hydroxypyruvate reductase n=1 Tax=Aromia moschata TaxID=1265417 RepID=A0AAV8XXE6_9CUCU|nr:hypothetical protein NQ318_023063 [Aromia moschata]
MSRLSLTRTIINSGRRTSEYIGNSLLQYNIHFLVDSLMSTMDKTSKFSETNRPKILVSNPTVPQVAFDLLEEYCIVTKAEDDTREDILAKVKGVDAIFWATHLKLDKEILEAAGPQMKTVGTMSAGYDHIDVEELKKRGIKLANTPEVLNPAVADIAVLLTLAASRRLHEGRLALENGQWSPKWDARGMLGQDIIGSTVGIVGLGGIGQAIVQRLKAFNVGQFIYTGHREKEEGKKLGAKFVSLDTLIKESDIVIVSCPLTSETKHMFNAELFSKMKKTSVFVNISRGAIVDQEALVKALKEGQIFAAGLDVMTPEPLPPTDELLKLPNAVILPHLGSATKQTRDAMAQLTATNILRGIGDEEMFTPVYEI